ncbi:F-box domain-containing protein [Mycena venus]|uniref:F-box domain-containing protein n=1 Tax=Mycena venus TaxID=2733690 RepID=A0A8H6Y530_9AGAR|nr:F-box domain-containing protein [Mycena venus]
MSAAGLRARLTEIEGEITQQSQILEQLHERRAAVQSQLDSILIYPVLTLPVEITSEIFVHCLPLVNARITLAHAPFVLLKICRRWREIALSTPKLWASLDINVTSLRNGVSPGPSSSSSSQWVDVAAAWLRRARGNPLSVTLRHLPEVSDEDTMFQPDLAFIRCISHHLESLQVHGLEQEEDSHTFDEALDFTPGTFPRLKRLVIGPAVPNTDLYDLWLAFFSDAPQLRELVLLGPPLESIEINAPFPWHQLTTFSGHNFQVDQFLEVLRLAPDLEQCSISVTFNGSEPLKSLTHSRLQHLTLRPDSDGDSWPAYDIFKLVTLPALQSLYVSQITDISPHAFEEFLSRSSAPLRTLAVSPDRGDVFSAWERSFRLLPDLEELHLGCGESGFQADFLKAFSSSEDRLFPTAAPFLYPSPQLEAQRCIWCPGRKEEVRGQQVVMCDDAVGARGRIPPKEHPVYLTVVDSEALFTKDVGLKGS